MEQVVEVNVKYIDSFCSPTMHIQYNTSLLLIIAGIFDRVECFSYCSSASYLKRISEIENFPQNIIYKKIRVIDDRNRVQLFLKYLLSMIQNIRLLLSSSRDDILIYNYNNLFAIYLINAFNHILKRKVIICCHGELELLSSEYANGGILYKVLQFFARGFYGKRNVDCNLFYLVLGDNIREGLKKYVSNTILEQLIVIDHPYIFPQNQLPNTEESSSSLRIGSVGVFNRAKGGDFFLKIASHFKKRVDLKMSITGRIFYNIDILKELDVDLPAGDGRLPLSYKDYNCRVRKLDFILFLYPASSYKLSASGAIFDAINMDIPIIALKNDYFSYLFDKFGKFGYLAEDVEGIITIIEELLKAKSLHLVDFEMIKRQFSICHFSEILKKQMHENHII